MLLPSCIMVEGGAVREMVEPGAEEEMVAAEAEGALEWSMSQVDHELFYEDKDAMGTHESIHTFILSIVPPIPLPLERFLHVSVVVMRYPCAFAVHFCPRLLTLYPHLSIRCSSSPCPALIVHHSLISINKCAAYVKHSTLTPCPTPTYKLLQRYYLGIANRPAPCARVLRMRLCLRIAI
jgi:hypothetical protein